MKNLKGCKKVKYFNRNQMILFNRRKIIFKYRKINNESFENKNNTINFQSMLKVKLLKRAFLIIQRIYFFEKIKYYICHRKKHGGCSSAG